LAKTVCQGHVNYVTAVDVWMPILVRSRSVTRVLAKTVCQGHVNYVTAVDVWMPILVRSRSADSHLEMHSLYSANGEIY